MKLSLSKSELLEIVSAQLGHQIAEIVITKSPTLYLSIEKKVAKDLNIPTPLTQSILNGDNLKIPAIKFLRSHVAGMGLAEAKWAVENWTRWTDFVKVKGKVPKMQFDSNWGNPILS
jgi:ribosomal protein L7/L12